LVIARSDEVSEGDAAISGSLHHAIGVMSDDRIGLILVFGYENSFEI
jgi:hypothetical protein